MIQTLLYHRICNRMMRCAAVVSFMLVCCSAVAFDELNEAQSLLFDSPHLVNTENGQSISYRYLREVDEKEPVEDLVTMNVTAQIDDERRDVEINFLTEERHLALPPFPGYRGNPVLMAMLEHVVREIGKDTGDGALYFRNRIRDVLASDTEISNLEQIRATDSDVIFIDAPQSLVPGEN